MGDASENVIGQVDLHSGFYCSASQYTCHVSKYYEKFINKYNLIKKNTEIKFKLPHGKCKLPSTLPAGQIGLKSFDGP